MLEQAEKLKDSMPQLSQAVLTDMKLTSAITFDLELLDKEQVEELLNELEDSEGLVHEYDPDSRMLTLITVIDGMAESEVDTHGRAG